MSNRIRPCLLGACAVILLGVVPGCNGSEGTPTTEETTSTTVTESTTTTVAPTTTMPATTTTVAPTTTTTEPQLEAPLKVPAEVRTILEDQAHEVALGFMDRVNRAGPGRGYIPLEPADPFEGAVRDLLEVTEALHEWTVYCYEGDYCKEGQWDPAGYPPEGHIEPIVKAGEGEIHAYSDGTFYVDGLYAANIGRVVRHLYYTGFRFDVVDGQAVLLDAAGRHGFLKEGVSYWLSALDESGSEFSATPVKEGLSVEVIDVSLRGGSALSPAYPLARVELTNNSDSTVWPYVEGSEITGEHAEEYNAAIPETIENNTATAAGWNLGYGRETKPGETSVVFVNVKVMVEQKESGTFSLPVYDRLTGTSQDTADVLFTLDTTFGRLKGCEVFLFGDDFLRDGECLRAPLLDHTWSR